MKRPKIKIPLDATDKTIELLCLFGIVLLFAIPYFYYDQLAVTVPAHFGLDGKPDAWGGKNNIWMLPIIGTFSYLVMTLIARFPHTFNYPIKINQENAIAQYRLGLKFLRRIKLLLVGFMTYFMFSAIQIALGKADSLGIFALVLLFVCILFLIGSYITQSRKGIVQ